MVNEDRLRQQFDSFFSGLHYRAQVWKQTTTTLDRQLARQFSTFRYVNTYENALSDIIRDLLDPDGPHGQADVFLSLFLIALNKRKVELPSDLDPRRASVMREVATAEGRRIDLVVDFHNSFGLGIENKPWDELRPRQLPDYAEYLRSLYSGSYILLYLGPGDPGEFEGRAGLVDSGRFHLITYEADIVPWLQGCRQHCEAESVRWFLRDMVDYVQAELSDPGNTAEYESSR